MVRASKKVVNGGREAAAEPPNPEAQERKRLKNIAISRNLISQTPSKPISPLNPSKTLLKHHGRDIVKKSQRKNKFLFSFPGLLAPITGGKIGELKDLGTKNPILYLDFPQGQIKLFGTIIYPKNRYLTLQFGRGGKNVMCEDYFDNMIVFSDAWWIGRKDENPEEMRLEFPKELTEEKHTDCDFKGGAGATCEGKTVANKPGKQNAEPLLPRAELEDDASEDSGCSTGKDLKDPMEVTPVRHSTRTSVKRFNFTEASSGDDSVGSGADISEVKEGRISDKLDEVKSCSTLGKTEVSSLMVCASDNMNVATRTKLTEQNQPKKSKESSLNKRSRLVQATISNLFEKVEEKSTGSVRKSPRKKVSAQKSRLSDSKQKDQVKVEEPKKKGALSKERKAGTGAKGNKKQSQVEDDDIEEFSSESEDIDGSDEDWAA